MKISDLTVTQAALSELAQMPSMVKFARRGDIFSLAMLRKYRAHHQSDRLDIAPKLISINTFEDGRRFLHDGHHRTTAIWLAGRSTLAPEEYVLSFYTYEEYNQINFEMGYVTPFDPRQEVRIADLSVFKARVWRVYAASGRPAAQDLVLRSRREYCILRPAGLSSVADLARTYQETT